MIPHLLIALGALLLLAGSVMLFQQKSTAKAPIDTSKNAVADVSTVQAAKPAEVGSLTKGLDFEKWVVDHTSKHYWKMVEWQGDKYHNGRFPESNRNPDILFEVRLGDRKQLVALECKWRAAFTNDRIIWATDEQIGIYNRFAKDRQARVFVVIGIGGTPAAPAEVYVVPLTALKFGYARRDYLEQFRANNTGGQFYFDFDKDALSLGKKSL